MRLTPGYTEQARRIPRRANSAILSALVISASILAPSGCESGYPSSRATSKADVGDSPARPVRVAPATLRKMRRTVPVSGTLAADDQAVLSLKVPGRLNEITVDLGSRVSKGQVVARLDPTDFDIKVRLAQAAVEQARARLGLPVDGTDDRVDPDESALVRQATATREEASLTRERTVALYQQQLVPQSQLDAADAALRVAEGKLQDAFEESRNRQGQLSQRRSELEIAKQQLADTTLTSTTDGAVRLRQATVGEFLPAGTPVVTIVRIHPLRLRLAVPEREALTVKAGQTVRFTLQGDPNAYEGRIVRLSPALSEQDRTLLVEAEVPNEQGQLRPGSFAEAEIQTESDQPAVVVRASALVKFAGIEKVISVREGRAVEKRVRTGRREQDVVEILDGLAEGEPVVVEPGNLVGGQPVTITP